MSRRNYSGPTKDEIRMNMAALQRIDPFIVKIIQSASQVALYKYISNEWDKTDVEGTLFVYERNCEPTFGFLILNRRSANNWIQPIVADINTQLQPPFLLYKTKDGAIYGIWFYEARDCELVGEAMSTLIKKSEGYDRCLLAGTTGGTDLASLLMKAQNQNTEAEKMKVSESSGGDRLLRLLSREADHNQADTIHSAPSNNSVEAFFAQASLQEQNSFANFMMNASNTNHPMMHGLASGGQQPAGVIPLPNHPPVTESNIHGADSQIVMRNLFSNPGVMSLEEIERSQHERGETPSNAAEMPPMPAQATKADELEADLKKKLHVSHTARGGSAGGRGARRGTPTNQKYKSPGQPQLPRQARPQAGTPKQAFTYASAVTQGQSGPTGTKGKKMVENSSKSSSEMTDHDTGVQLLSPMVFAGPEMAAAVSAVHPPTYEYTTQVNGGHDTDVEPLTKGQFLQAMLHLLKTDDQVVEKLHVAYVEALKSKLH